MGEPLRPLARIASGGENSRLMLALKTVLSEADDTARSSSTRSTPASAAASATSSARSSPAWRESHQVLCVTHLPQLAAFADVHLQGGQGGGRRAHAHRGAGRCRRTSACASWRRCSVASTPGNQSSAREMLERAHAGSAVALRPRHLVLADHFGEDWQRAAFLRSREYQLEASAWRSVAWVVPASACQ